MTSLQDLLHMAWMLLVDPTADDYVIYPGKSCLEVSDGPLVPLKGGTCIPQAKGHPLLLRQAEGDDDGGLLHILSGLTGIYLFGRSISEKTVQPAAGRHPAPLPSCAIEMPEEHLDYGEVDH